VQFLSTTKVRRRFLALMTMLTRYSDSNVIAMSHVAIVLREMSRVNTHHGLEVVLLLREGIADNMI
jgi:hypothetical protein